MGVLALGGAGDAPGFHEGEAVAGKVGEEIRRRRRRATGIGGLGVVVIAARGAERQGERGEAR